MTGPQQLPPPPQPPQPTQPHWPAPQWPAVPPAPPAPPAAPEPERPRVERPAEVDTGCWLWAGALSLFSLDYGINLLVNGVPADSLMLRAVNAGFSTAVVAALVTTLLLLMRSGYGWARTVLTGGAAAAVVYAVNGLIEADPRALVAVPCGLAGIAGAVLIGGGTWLLYRPEAQEYFTR